MLRFFSIAVWASMALGGFISSSEAQEERLQESRDGVTVTLPADEADLADQMLKLTKVWQEAMQKGLFSKALSQYLEDPQAATNSIRRVTDHLGDQAGPAETIGKDWEEAAEQGKQAVAAWKAWERGFNTMQFWTKAEAEAFRQRDQFVFPDTIMQVKDGGAGFLMRPSVLSLPVDLDALPDPKKVEPHRLDFVLGYPLGSTPGQIMKQYNELLNAAITNQEKGVVAIAAPEIYEAMYRRVLERALERTCITGDKGDFFRKAISFALSAARNDQVDSKRGSKRVFGQRIRRVAGQEWQVPVEDLVRRMREAPAWPSPDDGPAEEAVREVALAMVVMSLQNAGDSFDGWIRAQEKPLDADGFSARLDIAAGDDGWEAVFRRYCGSLADQFETVFVKPEEVPENAVLSAIEQGWPRALSGRVEVVHPPGLAETAKLAAGKIDALLDKLSVPEETAKVPPFGEKHEAILIAHGLKFREKTAETWDRVLGAMAGGGIPKLWVRLWFSDEALAELQKGTVIPGMELDPATGDASITQRLNFQKTFRIPSEDPKDEEDVPESNVIVPIPRDQIAGLSTEIQALAIERNCREHLSDLFEAARDPAGVEERFYQVAGLVAGEALIRDVIASKDREWFVVGFSNWLAEKMTDAEFGAGAGRRVFEKRWPPDRNETDRDKVDLIKWPADDDEKGDIPFEATHVYFATLAVGKAFEGKDADFVKRFIGEIQKTPRKRVNMGTVYRAYQAAGGGNLKKIAQQITVDSDK